MLAAVQLCAAVCVLGGQKKGDRACCWGSRSRGVMVVRWCDGEGVRAVVGAVMGERRCDGRVMVWRKSEVRRCVGCDGGNDVAGVGR